MPQYASRQLVGLREAESSNDACPHRLTPRACQRPAPPAPWHAASAGTPGAVSRAYRRHLVEGPATHGHVGNEIGIGTRQPLPNPRGRVNLNAAERDLSCDPYSGAGHSGRARSE
jgi:hypothetical protein